MCFVGLRITPFMYIVTLDINTKWVNFNGRRSQLHIGVWILWCWSMHNTENKGCHNNNFVFIGGNGCCRHGNPRCHQIRQSWHRYNALFSVKVFKLLFKLLKYYQRMLPSHVSLCDNELGHHDFNTLRPRQHGRHYPDDIFKCIFLNENV